MTEPTAVRRPEGDPLLTVTFLYYRDLPRAMAFYEHVLGVELAIDQGWSKIYRLGGTAHVGLVDETRGSHRAADPKPVQVCLRVSDVDAWHAWAASCNVTGLSAPKDSPSLGIRAFVFNDPEGYQIEIQSVLA
ncbi:VOC family protein [Microvirga tunisiensis]|uniref:VOC family protein n=2 Tax=Pannonibacter tanglangensis TaxID=2750084 RepID=A0ABW9ZK37_9HYPH|nr:MULTISPECIES: VOC family protein [unclassified Pannonibacter]NBN65043.1 VOC family protein [Pannonibacter sp. XCT-34]NBN79981.1 VOC family protein [Pannonibacter sp. XCT-53]